MAKAIDGSNPTRNQLADDESGAITEVVGRLQVLATVNERVRSAVFAALESGEDPDYASAYQALFASVAMLDPARAARVLRSGHLRDIRLVDIRFSALYTPDMPIALQDFLADRHAAAYVPALEAHPMATNRLFDLLNDPENEQRLVHASELDQPALLGVSRFVESDPELINVFELGSVGYRFRQAVGVAIRLKMEALGWSTTGRKAAVSGAHYFTKAECYSR